MPISKLQTTVNRPDQYSPNDYEDEPDIYELIESRNPLVPTDICPFCGDYNDLCMCEFEYPEDDQCE